PGTSTLISRAWRYADADLEFQVGEAQLRNRRVNGALRLLVGQADLRGPPPIVLTSPASLRHVEGLTSDRHIIVTGVCVWVGGDRISHCAAASTTFRGRDGVPTLISAHGPATPRAR